MLKNIIFLQAYNSGNTINPPSKYEKSTEWYCHAHLDEFGKDLGAILDALRRSSTADVLLLQEEGDQPGDKGHTGCQVLVPGAEGALIVPRHWHIQGFWPVVGQVYLSNTEE